MADDSGLIAEAKRLAKQHGVDLAAWNGEAGKEYICLHGDGEKLQGIKPDLEALGWRLWPQSPDQEGWMMEFSLTPPPDKPAASDSDISVEDETGLPAVSGDGFRYAGGGSLWLNNMMVGLFFLLLILVAGGRPSPARIALGIGVFLAVDGLLLVWNWVVVKADAEKLYVRQHVFGQPIEARYGDISRVRLFSEKGRNGGVTKYLGVNLKSGKSFDLFLPERKRKELHAFLLSKMPRG